MRPEREFTSGSGSRIQQRCADHNVTGAGAKNYWFTTCFTFPKLAL